MKITFRDVRRRVAPVRPDTDGMGIALNRSGSVRFAFASANVTVQDGECVREFTNAQGTIEAPDGVKVLPYFVQDGEYHVVMVEQFRLAVPGVLLEPPGGALDGTDVRACMAKELMEEAHIAVHTDDISLVYAARIQPSFMDSTAHGGIVRIDASQLPVSSVCGEWESGEYTVLAIRPLIPLLRERDSGQLALDLETCLLLDAVATAVGLVTKRY